MVLRPCVLALMHHNVLHQSESVLRMNYVLHHEFAFFPIQYKKAVCDYRTNKALQSQTATKYILIRSLIRDYQIPCASIALATFSKPAIFAPMT